MRKRNWWRTLEDVERAHVESVWKQSAGNHSLAARAQYHATTILNELRAVAKGSRLLGVAAMDPFVPIFTFVFGQAEVEGHCALASTYRLEEERYGLPRNEQKLQERLTKEAVHELGHTFGLNHCDDWQCVMASSHSVEFVDMKRAEFCQDCARVVGPRR